MIYFFVIAVLLAVYSVFEAKSLKVKKNVINDAPLSMKGKKIVVFSDVHIGRFVSTRQLKLCADKINAEGADYVFFAGDLAEKNHKNYDAVIDEVCLILSGINAKCGKFAVFGNHDCNNNAAFEFVNTALDKGGFTILENDGVPLECDVFLAGVTDGRHKETDIDLALKYCPKRAYKMILCHAPDYILDFVKYGINVQFSGHSHGGQVFIPFLYKKFLPLEAKIFSRGNHRVENSMLYISNGVGVHTLPFRFLAPPDILLFYFK